MGSSESKDFKRDPNQFCVEDSREDDNSAVFMTSTKMEELSIIKGDNVLLTGCNPLMKGKKRRNTVVIC
jgi:hypothetical protein